MCDIISHFEQNFLLFSQRYRFINKFRCRYRQLIFSEDLKLILPIYHVYIQQDWQLLFNYFVRFRKKYKRIHTQLSYTIIMHNFIYIIIHK